MKAVVFEAAGALADVLSVKEIDVPSPGAGELLVRIDARPIQPSDVMFVEGRYRWKPAFPQVAGVEASGIVVGGGDGVGIVPGTRVAFRHPGTWAEYAAVPADRVYTVPTGVAPEAAAQFSLNPPTAWALLDMLDVKSGDWIVINAATSAVAQIVRALARRRGVQVVGIVRRSSAVDLDFPSVPDDAHPLADRVLAQSGGAQMAGLLDAIGGKAIIDLLPALRQGATIVSYAVLTQDPAPVRNADIIYRNLSWKGFGLDFWLAHAGDRRKQMIDELWDAILRGDLVLPVRRRYGLEEIQAAVADAVTNRASGKVLLEG